MKKGLIFNFLDGEKRKFLKTFGKGFFWFLIGAILGLGLFVSFIFIIFKNLYSNVIYPGVLVNGVNFGGKTQKEVQTFFAQKNQKITEAKFVFTSPEGTATISAGQLNFGYNEELLAKQAYTLGRSKDPLSNISLVLQAYLNTINLPPSYRYDEDQLQKALLPIVQKISLAPVDALFTFKDGRVLAFRASLDGQGINMQALKSQVSSKAPTLVLGERPQTITISLPIKVLKPKITTDKVNSFGIKELIGLGTSLFQHSIPNRVYNITLAATRLNGILIPPGEVFSFNKALGDVSAFTGYQQAYVIQNGRTVLGDGGGVCQVSTTLFRAALNAGLPIIERTAHAYRVGYYEQDSPPGIDATVYGPSVDLKFKNDTDRHILIQTAIDPTVERLTFMLYGTKDGRMTIIDKPVILSQSSPPPPLYQDDPTLPKGVIRQIDFEAWGANVYFTRQVMKNGKTIISDKFVSNFQPWRAIYLRGTKE